MGKVNLVRPNGQVITVDESVSDSLVSALGYSRETTASAAEKGLETAKREYYDEQNLATLAEGVASGATLGTSDVFLEAIGLDTAERSKYNPNVRLAGEVTGMIGSSVVGLGPTGMLSKGAAKAMARTTSVGRKLAIAGLEGAGLGGGAAISQAALSDEPMTVEAALAHMGVGALLGVGTQALGHTLEGVGNRVFSKARAAREAAEQAVTKEAGVVINAESWGAAHRSLKATAESVKKEVKGLSEMMEREVASWTASGGSSRLIRPLRKVVSATDEKALNKAVTNLKTAWEETQVATGVTTKSSDAMFGSLVSRAKESLTKKQLASALDSMPASPAALRKLSDGKLELLAAAVSKQGDEAAKPLMSILNEAGISVKSTDDIAGALRALKANNPSTTPRISSELVAKPAPKEKPRGTPWSMAGLIRQKALSDPKMAAGIGAAGVLTDNQTLKGIGLFGMFMAARGNATKMISESAERFGKGLAATGRTVQRARKPVASLFTPMAFPEYKEKPRTERQAARAAIDEVNELANGIESTTHAATEEIRAEGHGDFDRALNRHIIRSVKALQEMAPKNPGTVVVGGKDVWEPTDLQAARFAEQRFVFNHPFEAGDMFMSGELGYHGIEAMKVFYPATHLELSTELLNRYDLAALPREQRNLLSDITGIPVDASRKPDKIAAWQLAYAPMPPQNQPPPPSQSGLGFSAGKEELTPAQKLGNA